MQTLTPTDSSPESMHGQSTMWTSLHYRNVEIKVWGGVWVVTQG
jgi:hypothetical protein